VLKKPNADKDQKLASY